MERKGGSGARALQVLADHRGWYDTPRVTLVFDLSGPMKDPLHAPYLYACDEEASWAHVARPCIQRGTVRFPAEGVFYKDHDRMIARLVKDRAFVQTLVVMLPKDDGHDYYYSNPNGWSKLATENRLQSVAGPLRDVMAFASSTAERVVLFNAGSSLQLRTRAAERLPKPLAYALLSKGMRFPACRELVIHRSYRLNEARRDKLNDNIPNGYSEGDPIIRSGVYQPYFQPMWGISSRTFPSLRAMHTIADYIGVDPSEIRGFRDQVVENVIDKQTPRPDLSLMEKSVMIEGLPQSTVYYGIGCTVGPELPPDIYHTRAFESAGLQRPGILSIPPSENLPTLYTDTYELLERMRRAKPP